MEKEKERDFKEKVNFSYSCLYVLNNKTDCFENNQKAYNKVMSLIANWLEKGE